MAASAGPNPRLRPAVRILGRVLVVGLLLALIVATGAFLWIGHVLRASLPQVEGRIVARGLSSRVLVKRDALGIPTIQGASREDVAWATGFVHAQDRFFQMDLSRRRAAGELAELFGPRAVEADKQARVHRFRARSKAALAASGPAAVRLAEAYTRGVNAGLSALGSKPFEYLLLRTDPAPWVQEDCILVVASMFFVLQDAQGRIDSERGLAYDVLPRALADFLLSPATDWEAPDQGPPAPMAPVPGPDVIDLCSRPPAGPTRLRPQLRRDKPEVSAARRADSLVDPDRAGDLVPGSNNWAVAGAHTASGSAIIANDMHLGISVPNTWYRVSLAWTDTRPRRVTGVTLPGAPIVIVGSNGDIAWGFTNAPGDWSDLVLVEPDPSDAGRYLTPTGSDAYGVHTERIRVTGAPDVVLTVKETTWGPIVDSDYRGRPRALKWVAHEAEGMNLRLAGIERAESIDEAIQVANTSGIPAENFVVGDRAGHIAWTIAGRIPRRVGFDGLVPVSWRDGTCRWDGWLSPAEYPKIVDPAVGRIWTANQRVVSGEMEKPLGHGEYDQGARARQIRDDLAAIESAVPRDMLKVQLDDRALFLARWRDLALATLDEKAVGTSADRREFRRLLQQGWTGHASTDSVGYRLTKAFRLRVAALALDPLYAPVVATGHLTAASARARTTDGPLWALVSQRPQHLLSPNYANWSALLLQAIDDVARSLTENGRKLEDRTWGEANTTRIRHPLSAALPAFVGRWLDMPAHPLPGDGGMPRVQTPTSGASERMAVTPGREQEAYFHMPGGQSGHPLSPHYGDMHAAWEKGEPTRFLPGWTVHTLVLAPR